MEFDELSSLLCQSFLLFAFKLNPLFSSILP